MRSYTPLASETNLKEFMKEHGLQNRATKGSKLLEVANKLKLNDFNSYIRTDKLTSKQGIINITDNYSKGTHVIAFYENKYFDSFCIETS